MAEKKFVGIGVSLGLILLLIISIFIFSIEQGFLESNQIHTTGSSLVSDSSTATVYKINWASYPKLSTGGGTCDTLYKLDVRLGFTSEQKAESDKLDALMPSDTPEGTFTTRDVSLNNIGSIANACTDFPEGRDVLIENPEATCDISRNVDRISYNCNVKATLYPIKNGERSGGNFFGGGGGTITITIPKDSIGITGDVIVDETIPPNSTDSATDEPTGIDSISTTIFTEDEEESIFTEDTEPEVTTEKVDFTERISRTSNLAKIAFIFAIFAVIGLIFIAIRRIRK